MIRALRHLGVRDGLDHLHTSECSSHPSLNVDAVNLANRIIPWLQETHARACLLIARSSQLLESVCTVLDAAPITATGEHERQFPDPLRFWPPANDKLRLRTMISLAALIRSSGAFARSVLDRLRLNEVVRETLELKWQIEHHLAYTEHTDGQVHSASACVFAACSFTAQKTRCGSARSTSTTIPVWAIGASATTGPN